MKAYKTGQNPSNRRTICSVAVERDQAVSPTIKTMLPGVGPVKPCRAASSAPGDVRLEAKVNRSRRSCFMMKFTLALQTLQVPS